MPDEALRAGLSGYAVAPGLSLKQWDAAQAVVFHPATNSTHLVDELAASVLAALLAAAAGSERPPLPRDESADDRLSPTLDALSQAGLIGPCPT